MWLLLIRTSSRISVTQPRDYLQQHHLSLMEMPLNISLTGSLHINGFLSGWATMWILCCDLFTSFGSRDIPCSYYRSLQQNQTSCSCFSHFSKKRLSTGVLLQEKKIRGPLSLKSKWGQFRWVIIMKCSIDIVSAEVKMQARQYWDIGEARGICLVALISEAVGRVQINGD